jgi:hypothetical protein
MSGPIPLFKKASIVPIDAMRRRVCAIVCVVTKHDDFDDASAIGAIAQDCTIGLCLSHHDSFCP